MGAEGGDIALQGRGENEFVGEDEDTFAKTGMKECCYAGVGWKRNGREGREGTRYLYVYMGDEREFKGWRASDRPPSLGSRGNKMIISSPGVAWHMADYLHEILMSLLTKCSPVWPRG